MRHGLTLWRLGIVALSAVVFTHCGGSGTLSGDTTPTALSDPSISSDPSPSSSSQSPSSSPSSSASASSVDSTIPSGPPIGIFVQPKDIIVMVDRDATSHEIGASGKSIHLSKVSDTTADDTDVGWFTRYGPSKNWKEASTGYNGHMWWTYNTTSKVENYATWNPWLQCPGKFEVSAYIPSQNAKTSNAQYSIKHANGISGAPVNQLNNPNKWMSLGAYNFTNSNIGVTLVDSTGEKQYTYRVGFDAMKWVWKAATATVTVTSPNGFETWNRSASDGNNCIDVKWNSSGLGDNVRIHLYQYGITQGYLVKGLNNNVPNTGSYCVPKSVLNDPKIVPGNGYYIGISNVNSYCDGTTWDFSDNSFTIIDKDVSTKPNLKPYTPSGWSGPLVVTGINGDKTSGQNLSACGKTYISWAIENNGSANFSSTFSTRLTLDGDPIKTWNTNGLNSGQSTTISNWSTTISAGTHTLQLYTDNTGAISESNENDNVTSQTFTWSGCPPVATITSPNNGNDFTTSSASVNFAGTCADSDNNLYSATFRIKNSSSETIQSMAASGGAWSGNTTLLLKSNATNTLTFECKDVSGLTASDSMTVYVNTMGTISGTVTSGGSSVGGGVTIVAIGPISTATGTNSSGNYTLSGLPAGTYDLKANKPGYSELVKPGISVSAGNTTVVNFSLTKIPTPSLYYSPNNIGVTMNSGELNGSQTFVIKNTGDATLTYAPAVNVNWASVQKNGATITGVQQSLAPGAQDVLTVSFNSNGVTASQSGNITLSHNDPTQGAQSIFLGLGINAPPPQPPPPAEQPAPSTPFFQPGLYGECPAQNACYADPVNTAIGNYTYHHTDLAIGTRGPLFTFTRYYNSLDRSLGPLGLGWTYSLNSQIISASNGDAYIRWGSGRVDKYTWNGSGFTSPAGTTATLLKGNYYVLTEDQNTWVFTGEGQLQTIADQHNNKLQLSYDAQKRLAKATNAVGDTLTFAYLSDTDPKLASVTDFTGRKVQFAYSGNLLTQVVDVLGQSFGLGYTNGYLTKIVERDGKTLVTNTYDSNGRVIDQYDALNNHTQFSYNTPSPGQTTVTDPAGNKHVYAYDALYRLISRTSPTGDQMGILYNTQNLPTEVTDATARKSISTYDNRGNLTSFTDSGGAKWFWTYDSLDRVTSHTSATGQSIAYSYDTNGNLSQAATTADGVAHTVTYAYLPTGEVTSVTDPMGFVTAYAYTDKGELKAITNANAEVTQIATDTLHRATAVINPLNHQWTYKYNAADDLISATTPLSKTSTYDYDARGQLVTETHPTGKISRGFDDAGRLTSVTTPQGTTSVGYNAINQVVSETDPKGQKTTFAYNALGYLTGVTDPTGKGASYTYDAMGRLLASTDSAGQKTAYILDATGRPQQIKDPLGNAITFSYNADSQITEAIDPAGNSFKTLYDGMSRKAQSVNPTLRSIIQQYDKNSRIIQLTTPAGTTMSWAYDKVGRILSQTSPSGSKQNFAYDAAGQLVSMTDANNKKTGITYDADGKITKASFADGVERTLSYDDANRVTQIAAAGKVRGYTYDTAGRIASTTDSWGKTISYAYTASGQLDTLTYPGNKVVKYGYDAADRLISVTDWLGGVTAYTYDAAGRLQQTSYPNGVKTTRSYDADSRVTAITHKKSDGTIIFSQKMSYDSRGNIVSIDMAPEPTAWLTESKTSYTPNVEDQYTQVGEELLGYDPVGQLLTRQLDSASTAHTFDVRGRLTGVDAGGAVTSYTYGPEGERIQKATAGQTTRYVVDTNAGLPRVLAELDASSMPSTYYIYGIGMVARAAATGNGIQYYHEDIQSNIVALTDKAAAVTDSYFYHIFGKVLSKTGTTPNPYQFAGWLGVENDGTLLYMRARYYDPAMGRFVSKDPIGIAGGLNLYDYVDGNPVSHADPSGLFITFSFEPLLFEQSSIFPRFTLESYLRPYGNTFLEDATKFTPKIADTIKIPKSSIPESVADNPLWRGKWAHKYIQNLPQYAKYAKESAVRNAENIVKGFRDLFKEGKQVEVKPNNPRSINRGTHQLERYNKLDTESGKTPPEESIIQPYDITTSWEIGTNEYLTQPSDTLPLKEQLLEMSRSGVRSVEKYLSSTQQSYFEMESFHLVSEK